MLCSQAGAPQLLPGSAVRADVSVLAPHPRGETHLRHHPRAARILPAGPRGRHGAAPRVPPPRLPHLQLRVRQPRRHQPQQPAPGEL